MRAVVFDGQAPRLCDDLPRPCPAAGEALLKVRTAGVCRTDLEILKGYMGFAGVMGHEFVGEVVEGPAEWQGRRVVGEINCLAQDLPPGELPKNHDSRRTVLGIAGRDGCFAEYVALPVENLHAVPEEVADEAAVFVEPLAAACRIFEQLRVDGSDRIAVLGDGRLGLLCSFVLRTWSDHVLLVGRHEAKLQLAARREISTVLEKDFDAASAYDVVVDATGSPEGFAAAMAAVRPLGTLVLKSTVAAETGMNLAPLVIDEVTVIGSRCGPFQPALDMLQRGEIDPCDLVTARYELLEGVDALRAAADGGQVKVLIDVE
jgi:threonine dehydrogenase-like Zn-dependent dehydrogenase